MSSLTFRGRKTRSIMCEHNLSAMCSTWHKGIMPTHYRVPLTTLWGRVCIPFFILPQRSLCPWSWKSHQHNGSGGWRWPRSMTHGGTRSACTGSEEKQPFCDSQPPNLTYCTYLKTPPPAPQKSHYLQSQWHDSSEFPSLGAQCEAWSGMSTQGTAL